MAGKEHDKTQAGQGGDAGLMGDGGPAVLEIPAVDVGKSAAFYEKVVGWKVQRGGAGDPRFEDASGLLIGRWVTGRAIPREPGLLPYIYVDRIDDAVGRVAAHHGEVVRAPYP